MSQFPSLSQADRQLLLGQTITPTGDDSGSLVVALSEGRYEDILRSPAAKAIFGTEQEDGPATDAAFAPADLGPHVTALVLSYIEAQGSAAWAEITVIGAACLSAFVQTNWTGPEFAVDPASVLPRQLAERWRETFTTIAPLVLEEGMDKHEVGRRAYAAHVYLGVKQSEERALLDRVLLRQLSVDGEDAYAMAPRPMYLYLARLLLVDIPQAGLLAERDAAAPMAHWWSARALLIQQSLLDYPAQTLMDQIIGHLDRVKQLLPPSPASNTPLKSVDASGSAQAVPELADENEVPSFETPETDSDVPLTSASLAPNSHEWEAVAAADRDVWARYLLEVGVVYSQHHMAVESKRCFTQAQAASGLQWEMTGAAGKRTRFQTNDVIQLVLLAKSAARADARSAQLPEALALNDDTLLEKITYADAAVEAHAGEERLQVLDECILLALCLNVQNENAAHGLTTELMRPFVARVLGQPTNWSVYTMGLLLRSRLETAKTRTAQRATLQLQALVDQITHPLPAAQEAGAAERLQYLWALSLPSQWEFERELANQFMTMGVVRSALDIYERLGMWDEIVTCYVLLEQNDVAQQIIKDQLALSPDSAKLWCVLGDLQRDPEHWRHAWEISGRRYARAMRSLGAHYYGKAEYALCVESYELALALNPLFEKSWYVLGCAAMQVSRWEVAAGAFQRVVVLEHDNGEAWNNLASVYMHMGSEHRGRAWYALREAVKAKFDSWRVWANFLTVSVGVGQMSSAIHAMTRVVELRADKDGAASVDLDALRTIIHAVTRGRILVGMDAKQAAHTEAQYVRYLEQLL
ncbi:hypothetical protein FBU31_002485, partial [Coemansia sp. 'formosensis']